MDFIQLLILALVFVVMGIALDNLIHYLLKETNHPPQVPSKSADTEVDKAPEGFVTEVRILRDVGRRLAVQTHGKVYRSASELEDEQRRSMNGLFNDLSTWLERPRPVAQPMPPTAPLKPEPIVEEQSPIQKPSLNPVNLLINAVQADVRPIQPPQSLAEQVDLVLQDLIKNSPLKARGIHLLEAPDRSLIVMIGMEKYPGIEAVPDEEVRQAIRAATEEWRKRMAKGRL